tara:strand:- start:644 stop:940 length:297 start_codon:yes stop_codon:yes gene_type:complete
MTNIHQNVENSIRGLILSAHADASAVRNNFHNFVDDFNITLAKAYVHGLQKECCAKTLWALQELLLRPNIHPDMADKIGTVCWNLQLFLFGDVQTVEA